jgi:photosystem II stability/assembly factor-like uncharacterized protein
LPANTGRTESSALSGWPAYLLTLLVAGAGAYAFSPRSIPPFPPTEVKADQLLVTGLAHQGSHLVAVGEQGHILVADSVNGPWLEARVEPKRGSTLTQVVLLKDGVALAVGHDSWILRSQDRGASWKEVHFDAERSEALMGIAGPFGGKLFAFGAFGLFLSSSDNGATWQAETLVEAAKPGAKAAPVAESSDPFAAYTSGGGGGSQGIAEHHLNAMAGGADGTLMLVGERGLIARSTDNGQTWSTTDPIYAGSFYGVMATAPGNWVVFGMRGNVFRSQDNGLTWTRSQTPAQTSMFGGVLTASGKITLVGASNTAFVSSDGGATFTLDSRGGGRNDLAAVIPLSDGSRLVAGVAGIRVDRPGTGLQQQQNNKK